MAAESSSDGQQSWELVVRRSFGISDELGRHDAREVLIECFEGELQVAGWRTVTRGTAEPIMDALMVLAENGELGQLLPADPSSDGVNSTSRATAYRVIDQGLTVVDPEHLAFGMLDDYPPEVVAALVQVLDRIGRSAPEQPGSD